MAQTATGRGGKAEATKAAIRVAAAELFERRGFARAGVREIAAAVGVDPALVMHHFGSKEALFIEVMSPMAMWDEIIGGPIQDLGRRLVRAMLEADRTGLGRRTFAPLVRASDSPEVRRRLEDSMERQFVLPLVERLSGPDRALRARLFASQAQGLMTTLWIVEDAALARAPVEDVVEILGGAMQLTLTGAPASPPVRTEHPEAQGVL